MTHPDDESIIARQNEQRIAAQLFAHGLSIDEIAVRMKVKPAWVEGVLEREKERLMAAAKARRRGA
jgi:transposase